MNAPGGFGPAEHEFTPGTVRGLRWWSVTAYRDTYGLNGMWGLWTPGENVAVCRKQDYGGVGLHYEPAPHEPCSCGFYAYWRPHPSPLQGSSPLIMSGVVEGYGRTLIGGKGFRAQKTRIVALALHPRSTVLFDSPLSDYLTEEDISQLLNELERRYEVPVYSRQDVMIREHPTTPDYAEPETGIVGYDGSWIMHNGSTFTVRTGTIRLSDGTYGTVIDETITPWGYQT